MLSHVVSIVYIFCFDSENRGSGVRFFQLAAHRTHKIASDKVSIMECDPESPSVTVQFFPEIQLGTLLRTDHGALRKICGLERLYKIIYLGVQENIVDLIVTIFCVGI